MRGFLDLIDWFTYICKKNIGDGLYNRNKLDCILISFVGGKGGMDFRFKLVCCYK